jgi:thioredoxin reductase
MTQTDANEAAAAPTAHVLIIGGGAAGETCALFLARAGIPSTILDRGASTLRRAWLHNLPGVEPIGGQDWLEQVREMEQQAGQTTYLKTRVTALGQSDDGFYAESDTGRHEGDFLVLATGQGPFDYAGDLEVTTEPPAQPYVRTNIVVDKWGESSLPKVYACGVLAGWPSQTLICAGSGATAAVGIATRLKGEYWVDHDSLPAGTPAST